MIAKIIKVLFLIKTNNGKVRFILIIMTKILHQDLWNMIKCFLTLDNVTRLRGTNRYLYELSEETRNKKSCRNEPLCIVIMHYLKQILTKKSMESLSYEWAYDPIDFHYAIQSFFNVHEEKKENNMDVYIFLDDCRQSNNDGVSLTWYTCFRIGKTSWYKENRAGGEVKPYAYALFPVGNDIQIKENIKNIEWIKCS